MENKQTETAGEVVLPQQTLITHDASPVKLPTLYDIEKAYLEQVLAHVGGNKTQAAKVLDISLKTLYNKLNSYKADSNEKK